RFNGSNWSDPQKTAFPSLVTTFQLKSDIIPASPALSAAGREGWKIGASDRMVCLDLDGNGQDEILMVADMKENNQRRVGLVRVVDRGWRQLRTRPTGGCPTPDANAAARDHATHPQESISIQILSTPDLRTRGGRSVVRKFIDIFFPPARQPDMPTS